MGLYRIRNGELNFWAAMNDYSASVGTQLGSNSLISTKEENGSMIIRHLEPESSMIKHLAFVLLSCKILVKH